MTERETDGVGWRVGGEEVFCDPTGPKVNGHRCAPPKKRCNSEARVGVGDDRGGVNLIQKM